MPAEYVRTQMRRCLQLRKWAIIFMLILWHILHFVSSANTIFSHYACHFIHFLPFFTIFPPRCCCCLLCFFFFYFFIARCIRWGDKAKILCTSKCCCCCYCSCCHLSIIIFLCTYVRIESRTVCFALNLHSFSRLIHIYYTLAISGCSQMKKHRCANECMRNRRLNTHTHSHSAKCVLWMIYGRLSDNRVEWLTTSRQQLTSVADSYVVFVYAHKMMVWENKRRAHAPALRDTNWSFSTISAVWLLPIIACAHAFDAGMHPDWRRIMQSQQIANTQVFIVQNWRRIGWLLIVSHVAMN